MAEVLLMPRISESTTEVFIRAWRKGIGEHIKKGDILADVEIDKGTFELESYFEGILLHIGASNGGKLQVDDLLAIIGKAGEDISEILKKYQIDKSSILSISEQPNEFIIDLPRQLFQKLKHKNSQFEIVKWYKNEGDTFIAGDSLLDVVIQEKIYKIGINLPGILLRINKESGSYFLSNFNYREDVCTIKCLFSEIPALPEEGLAPLSILDSFFYFKELEEHPYLKYSKVQLELYERFLDIELKAIQISLSEVDINDRSLKQQSLIKKEKEKEEKEYWLWLIYIILSPFIIYFIIRLFNFNVGEIFITGIFSASILAVGFSKKF